MGSARKLHDDLDGAANRFLFRHKAMGFVSGFFHALLPYHRNPTCGPRMKKTSKPPRPLCEAHAIAQFKKLRPQTVQALHAYRVSDLWLAAAALGHRILHADLTHLAGGADLERQLMRHLSLPSPDFRKKGALYEQLTIELARSAQHPGYLVLLEKIPLDLKSEVREDLMDRFWTIADYWEIRGVTFRCFFSSAQGRSPHGEEVKAPPGCEITERALQWANPFTTAL